VIIGSFNFTVAAQRHNAENLLAIQDAALAAKYRANGQSRRAVSLTIRDRSPPRLSPGNIWGGRTAGRQSAI
jgi:phosphatidylserine/phosphatidylglycerophosphate/cardiolipin synthase-like enzyme